jgi:hypothetical protein
MTAPTTTTPITIDEAVARILANHGMSTTYIATRTTGKKVIGIVCRETGQTFEMTVRATSDEAA